MATEVRRKNEKAVETCKRLMKLLQDRDSELAKVKKALQIEISQRKMAEDNLLLAKTIFIEAEQLSLSQSGRQVSYLIYHDRVTDLYTRAHFEEELRRFDTERELPLSVIMGDINNLKLTNDIYGHNEGDKLLRRIADIMKASCRKTDIIARWGSDEYSILLPKTDQKTAEMISCRIKTSCSDISDMAMHCGISLGVATRETMDEKINNILLRAEERLNKNKLIEAEENRKAVIASMLKKAGTFDYDTQEHTSRMQDLAFRMGKSLGLNQHQLEDLMLFAALHDIGKAALPANVLSKPGKLEPDEWDTVKHHTEIGYRITIAFPDLSRVAEAILYHHERWDGSGYPKGLKGEDIPLLVRILSIIDAYDAMTHERSYKKACSHQEAIKELNMASGKQFDPEFVKIFINIINEIVVPV